MVERVRLDSCELEDRLILLDVRTGTARSLSSDLKMRMHPLYAAGSFRFVEADADVSMPWAGHWDDVGSRSSGTNVP